MKPPSDPKQHPEERKGRGPILSMFSLRSLINKTCIRLGFSVLYLKSLLIFLHEQWDKNVILNNPSFVWPKTLHCLATSGEDPSINLLPHQGTQQGSCEHLYTHLTPCSLGNSRVGASPASLQKLDPRTQAVHRGEHNYCIVDTGQTHTQALAPYPPVRWCSMLRNI